MALRVTFSNGNGGEAVALDGTTLRVVAARSEAPGRPLDLELSIEGEPMTLHIKSLGSKRREDGSFDVSMRLCDLRRGQREKLERALGGG